MSTAKYKLAFVDDHPAMIDGLIGLLEADLPMEEYEILFKANNGREMQQHIDPDNLPDLIIMDIDMKVMSGPEAVAWLREKHPSVKVLVVSMHEMPEKVIPMLKLHVEGYMSKENTDIGIIVKAIQAGKDCFDPFVQDIMKNLSVKQGGETEYSNFEMEFFDLVCNTDLSHKEIADKMQLSPKKVETMFAHYYKHFDAGKRSLALKLRELGLG
ncbi:MAG: response regulator [Cyclobacteriaceae bacterium]